MRDHGRKRARSWKRSLSAKPSYARRTGRRAARAVDHAREHRREGERRRRSLHSSEGAAAVVTLRNTSAESAARRADRDHRQGRARRDALQQRRPRPGKRARIGAAAPRARDTSPGSTIRCRQPAVPASVSAKVGEGDRVRDRERSRVSAIEGAHLAEGEARRHGRQPLPGHPARTRRLRRRPPRRHDRRRRARRRPRAAAAGTSTRFQVFFIGDPRGARLEVSAPASTLG